MKIIHLIVPTVLAACFAASYSATREKEQRRFLERGPGKLVATATFDRVFYHASLLNVAWAQSQSGIPKLVNTRKDIVGYCGNESELRSTSLVEQLLAIISPNAPRWERGGAPKGDSFGLTFAGSNSPYVRVSFGSNFIACGEYWRRVTHEEILRIQALIADQTRNRSQAGNRQKE